MSPRLPGFRTPAKHKDEQYLKDAGLRLFLYQKPRKVQHLIRRHAVAIRLRHKQERLESTREECGKITKAALTTGHVIFVAFIVLKNLNCSSFQVRFKI